MISKFKIEILVACLLLGTLAIIFANNTFLRSTELTTANAADIASADDREIGGTSEAYTEILGNRFALDYKVETETLEKNYSIMSIVPDETFQRDLSWADRFEILIRSSREDGKGVKFYVKNFETGVSVEGQSTSLKYNESLINVSKELGIVTVHRDDFIVPHWWQQTFGVKGEAAKASIDNVRTFEFNVNAAGEGVIEVASIRCVGTWINSATLNQSLLWIWMSGILIGLIMRMLSLKKKLDDKAASASQLLAHNNLLITESATYQEIASRDPLTGLYNRYGLEAAFAKLSSKEDFEYSMLLFDLDKFKEINDNLGHSYGDRVLFDVATIVRSKLGDSDIVARWGGDEFLVILDNRTVVHATEFAEEIRQAILVSDLIYSCSFGICKSDSGSSFEANFSKADAALYESKNGGRNKVTKFRRNNGRRASDRNRGTVPEITLLPNNLPSSEFMIYE